MRLQLAIAAAALVLLARVAPAAAQTAFTTEVQIYVDDDNTQVVSPLVSAQADVNPETNVSASYVADVVTSASVDIVTQASATTIHDTRHQGTLGAARILGDWTLTGGYIFSTENDYGSHHFSLGLERRLNENATTVALSSSLGFDTVGRAHDDVFSRSVTPWSTALTLTQVVNPELVVQLGYELAVVSGYQASAYRFVPVGPMDGPPAYWVPETDPDQRIRHAFVLGANRHIGQDSAVQADYRLYRDSWGITSHTLQARLLSNLSKRVELRLRGRLYTQSGADFYQSNYTSAEQYMTIDRELSPLSSVLGGIKLSWKQKSYLELSGKLDLFYFAYDDFPRLTSRTGVDLGAGVSLIY